MSQINELKIKPIHPFAARMAPEIAFKALEGLKKDAVILDPMVGSGTVLRTISTLGFKGIGIDIDPLAVLMSKAGTTKINKTGFLRKVSQLIQEAQRHKAYSLHLPWIDEDVNTTKFITFWFGKKQISDLRRLSYVIVNNHGKYEELLKIALSRLIVTKRKGASLAADVSHSRPHKVRDSNDFNVFSEFEITCRKLSSNMLETPPIGKTKVKLGDARKLRIPTGSVDAIITSPPYLNAIDYMRGHKLALVWLGYPIDDLSVIRGKSVGAEKAPNENANMKLAKELTSKIYRLEDLPNRKINMIYRYALDMHGIFRQCSRVLKRNGKATFVIGNTSQNGVYIENTSIASEAAKKFGLALVDVKKREIPQNRRYLPPPTAKELSSFKNRMKTEAVMTFVKS